MNKSEGIRHKEKMGKYDAYTNLEKPVSKKYGRMLRENRAKQFAPFTAVKGHTEAICSKEKIIVPKRILSEEKADLLNRKLLQIQKNDIVTAVYYSEEDFQYLQVTGMVARIDFISHILQVVETEILFDHLYDLQIEQRK